ncbi:lactobin A/cerein 7B family class IIb bacteriocin [Bacteroides sp. GD17]|jgi:hypothetical protein|uniref:lactobin A/cerein 7B family class IIb bacteriocin n=1 Tax=Bacteroides sp. GD17 TaxID=3139826 RepID=UPI0025FACFD6|nr:lactobin A/cerein 7B family class IIb bacteriocin [uncultured Bacteroides sp.]
MKNFKENAVMQEMNLEEQKEVNGGIGIVGSILLTAAISMVVDQWPDIKQGVSDAWNGI